MEELEPKNSCNLTFPNVLQLQFSIVSGWEEQEGPKEERESIEGKGMGETAISNWGGWTSFARRST